MGISQELAERRATPAERDRAIGMVPLRGLVPNIRHQNDLDPVGRAPAGLNASEHPAPTEIPDMSDFQIADQGSIFLIRPLTEAARQWLDENVVSEPWQWVQGALCVEARFARDLVIEIEEAGFIVTR
jgi:hypothetical protein